MGFLDFHCRLVLRDRTQGFALSLMGLVGPFVGFGIFALGIIPNKT